MYNIQYNTEVMPQPFMMTINTETNSPLRVAMILNRYLPIIGGAEVQANRLSQQLLQRGHHVEVITRRIHKELPQTDQIEGIKVNRLSPVGLGHVANAMMFFRFLIYLVRHRRDFDIFHAHSIGPIGLAAIIAGQLTHTPVVLKIATSGDISRKTKTRLSAYTRFIRRFVLPDSLWLAILKRASAIVVLSQAGLTEANENSLGDQANLIANGIDTKEFHPPVQQDKLTLRQRLDLPVNHTVFFFSGRLVARKRIDVLIDALAQVVPKYEKVLLVIAGSGKLQSDSVEEKLVRQVQQHKLQENVTFTGSIDNVADYLQAADGFVFASEREGMPNVILEAMASGLPIIASRIAGVLELLDDSRASLCDVNDIDAFAQAMLGMIENPQQAQDKAHNALECVKKQYAIAIIAEKYEALYYRLLRG